MRNQRKLHIEQLDRKLTPFQGMQNVIIPDKGWIYTIRVALNITLAQLGTKLNMTKQGINKIEERESNGTISIKSLKEIAEVLDMHFAYGFIPKDKTLENLVSLKAEELARKIVLRTSHTMKLENQGNSDVQIARAIAELTQEIKNEMPKSLWD